MAGFAALVVLVGVLIWSGLVIQIVQRHRGGYCEDFAICFEAKPLELTIQGILALVGILAALGFAIRCVSYARGHDPPDVRMVLRAEVAAVALAGWIVYTVRLTELY